MNIGKFQESFLEQFKNLHTNFSNLISDPFKQMKEAKNDCQSQSSHK